MNEKLSSDIRNLIASMNQLHCLMEQTAIEVHSVISDDLTCINFNSYLKAIESLDDQNQWYLKGLNEYLEMIEMEHHPHPFSKISF